MIKINGVTMRDLARECKNDLCFVAGTLVHTDKGLVPIEQLKVGDRVLSKPESGEGELAYKAITRTFKSQEKQPIFMVSFYIDSVRAYTYGEGISDLYKHKVIFMQEAAAKGEYLLSRETMYLFCTSDYPFWVIGKGWVPVYQLKENDQFALFDGDTATINSVYDYWPRPLEATTNPDIAICPCYEAEDAGIGCIVDFRFGYSQFILDKEERESNTLHPAENFIIVPSDASDPLSKLLRPEEDKIGYADDFTEDNINYLVRHFYQSVYNIEVEDYYTYYVGTAGVWVGTQC
ncbi:MAG: Hint domain-containing protein [Moraxellaceae bacterium]|nr:Hint domain-containing protein [Moraxellaceae bacterium]